MQTYTKHEWMVNWCQIGFAVISRAEEIDLCAYTCIPFVTLEKSVTHWAEIFFGFGQYINRLNTFLASQLSL